MINGTEILPGLSGRLLVSSRRWKIAIGIVALALPFALAGVTMFSPGAIFGSGGGSAMASRLSGEVATRLGGAGANLLAMVGLRSPGERSPGRLVDSKHRQTSPTYSSVPHERALAKIRPPKGTANQLFPTSPVGDVSIQAMTDALAPTGGQDATGFLLPGSISHDGGGPGGGLIFAGGGGGSIVGPISAPTASPITTGVPEPSTWALMLMGFGGIGVSLRRARRRDRQLRQAVEVNVAVK